MQPYQIQMASKQSPSTSTFIEEGQGPMPQLPITAHGKSDVPTTSAHSYAVPKYVTDVARLISASAESRRMFLTEVTRTCLEAAKKDKADSNQTIASQLDTTAHQHKHNWYKNNIQYFFIWKPYNQTSYTIL